MKYRIIIKDNNSCPYSIQKKDGFFSLWKEIGCSDSAQLAELKLQIYIRAKIPSVGTVVKIYDEQDLLVDKLKGNV